MTKKAHHPARGHNLPYDILYNGKQLHWYGMHLEFPATSGQNDYKRADQEGVKDYGPIPEGWYDFSVQEAKPGKNADDYFSHEGVQSFSPSPDWGTQRVRLHLKRLDEMAIRQKVGDQGLKVAKSRGGFYLHNSHKGYTHGCVEVSDSFFTKLAEYRRKKHHKAHLTLRVHYRDIHTDTYGATDK
ncbi:MAG TPA: hypothetical protein VH682_05365 [Gemmataceae bacterium]|jgi:hypothetical protein